MQLGMYVFCFKSFISIIYVHFYYIFLIIEINRYAAAPVTQPPDQQVEKESLPVHFPTHLKYCLTGKCSTQDV